MKCLKFIVLALATGFFLGSCNKEDGNPTFGPDEVYVYENVAETFNVAIGDEFTLDMIVSPNDGTVQCVWKLDGVIVCRGKSISYVFTDSGSYQLSFEASKGKGMVKKYFTIIVN